MKGKEKALKIIDDLKDSLFDSEICKALDACQAAYLKIAKNANAQQCSDLISKLQSHFNGFVALYESVNKQTMFSRSCYVFSEIVNHISSYLQVFGKQESIPARHTTEYMQTLSDISKFLASFSLSLSSKTANSRLFSSVSQFEANYFGTYVSNLTKTKAEKSYLSAISVSIGDLCTKVRNIDECQSHQEEIEELRELFDIQNSYISVNELQDSILSSSHFLSNLATQCDQSLASILQAQSKTLSLLANKTVVLESKDSRKESSSDSEEDDIDDDMDSEYSNMSKHDLIVLLKSIQNQATQEKNISPNRINSDFQQYEQHNHINTNKSYLNMDKAKPKKFKLPKPESIDVNGNPGNNKLKQHQKRISPPPRYSHNIFAEDESDIDDYDLIKPPEPLFHPKMPQTPQPTVRSMSPQPIKKQLFEPNSESIIKPKKLIAHVKEMPKTETRRTSAMNGKLGKFSHLVSAYSQSVLRKSKKNENSYQMWK